MFYNYIPRTSPKYTWDRNAQSVTVRLEFYASDGKTLIDVASFVRPVAFFAFMSKPIPAFTDSSAVDLWPNHWFLADSADGPLAVAQDPEVYKAMVRCQTNPFIYEVPAEAWNIVRKRNACYLCIATWPGEYMGLPPTDQQFKTRIATAIRCNPEIVSIEVTEVPPPRADAGLDRILLVDHHSATLTQPMVLDGSASAATPDSDYSWSLISSPTQQPLNVQGIRCLITAKGAIVPSQSLGPWEWQLTVKNSRSSDSDRVIYNLVRPDQPPVAVLSEQAHTFYLGAGYRLREDIIIDGSASYDPDGDDFTMESYRVPWPSGQGLLPWKMGPLDSTAVILEKGTVVPLQNTGTHRIVLKVSNTGFLPYGQPSVSETFVDHELTIVGPTVHAGDTAPLAVEEKDLLANGVDIPVTVEMPENAVEADAYKCRVDKYEDGEWQRLGKFDVAAADVEQGHFKWGGQTSPAGSITSPGMYALTLQPMTEGMYLPFPKGRTHQLEVVRFAFEFSDWTFVDEFGGPLPVPELERRPGLVPPPIWDVIQHPRVSVENLVDILRTRNVRRLSPITPRLAVDAALTTSWLRPRRAVFYSAAHSDRVYYIHGNGAMPAMKIRIGMEGPTEADLADQEVKVYFEVLDDHGDGGVYRHPQNDSLIRKPNTYWKAVLPDSRGGKLQVHASATYKGVVLTDNSSQSVLIKGTNPSRQYVRNFIGHSLEKWRRKAVAEEQKLSGLINTFHVTPEAGQSLAYHLTQFQHFIYDEQPEVEASNGNPISNSEGRFGLGQLPFSPHLAWNPNASLEEMCRLLIDCRVRAVRDYLDANHTFGNVPELTQAQLDLEMWCRYLSGNRYHILTDQRFWTPPDKRRPFILETQIVRSIADSVSYKEYPGEWLEKGEPEFQETQFYREPYETILEMFTSGITPDVAILQQASLLRWGEIWRFLTYVEANNLPVTTETLYQAAASTPVVGPSVTAALRIFRFSRKNISKEADVSDEDFKSLGILVNSMMSLPAFDQFRLLGWIGCEKTLIEGTVSVLQQDTNEHNGSSDTLPGVPYDRVPYSAGVPFGDWNKPGNMPDVFYIGQAAHLAIASYYSFRHTPPHEDSLVWTNTIPTANIVSDLAARHVFDPDEIIRAMAVSKPDIFEFSLTAHTRWAPGNVFEIKPVGLEKVAKIEALWYGASLTSAGVPTTLGLPEFANTSGLVAAPYGWFRFSSPDLGVITYRYIRAHPLAIRRREEAKNKKVEQSTYFQKFRSLGYAEMQASINAAAVWAIIGTIIGILSAPLWA